MTSRQQTVEAQIRVPRPRPNATDQLNHLTGRLRSALASAVLDGFGYRRQCLEPGVVALDPGMPLLGGDLVVGDKDGVANIRALLTVEAASQRAHPESRIRKAPCRGA